MIENNISKTDLENFLMLKHIYVDKLMALLTGEEYKVLIFAVRQIDGFHKEKDHISISQFTKGIRNPYEREKLVSLGTGLCIETVRKCLANLIEFGLLIKVAKNNRKTNKGDLWALQQDPEKIKWDLLEERLEQKSRKNTKRMSKARSNRRLSE